MMFILKSSLAQNGGTGMGNDKVEVESEILVTSFHSTTTEKLALLLQSMCNKTQTIMMYS